MTAVMDSYIDGEINDVVMRPLRILSDSRGWLVELFRQDEVMQQWWPVMTYVSQTLPGVTRGPHEHLDQTDGFGFFGPSDFKLYLWDTRVASATRGRRMVLVVGASNPAAVWIPPGLYMPIATLETVPDLFSTPRTAFTLAGGKESLWMRFGMRRRNQASFPWSGYQGFPRFS